MPLYPDILLQVALLRMHVPVELRNVIVNDFFPFYQRPISKLFRVSDLLNCKSKTELVFGNRNIICSPDYSKSFYLYFNRSCSNKNIEFDICCCDIKYYSIVNCCVYDTKGVLEHSLAQSSRQTYSLPLSELTEENAVQFHRKINRWFQNCFLRIGQQLIL